MSESKLADEAFEQFTSSHENHLTENKEFVRHYWRAAWAARGEHDLKAVEAVRPRAVHYQAEFAGTLAPTACTTWNECCDDVRRRIKGEQV